MNIGDRLNDVDELPIKIRETYPDQPQIRRCGQRRISNCECWKAWVCPIS